MKPSRYLTAERTRIRAALLLLVVGLTPVLGDSALAQRDSAARQLDFANGLFLRKIYDMAAAEYAAYVEAFPGDATEEYARFQWGESLYNLQHFEQAAAVYQELLNKFPQGAKRSETLLRLGMIAFQRKLYEQAEETLSRLLDEKPPADITEVARYYLASTHLAREEYAKAHEVFTLQLDEAPEGLFASYARLGLGTAIKQLGKPEEAISLWRQVVASEGDSKEPRFRNLAIEALFRLGETLDTMGRYEEAAEAFAELAAKYPDSALLTSSLYREAWAWFSAGNYAEARRKAEALLDRPGLPERDAIRAGSRYLIGMTYFESKAYDEAIRVFREVLELPKELPEWEPYAAKSRYQTVWSFFLKGDNAGARQEADQFLQAFEGHPLGADVRFVKGEALFRQELYKSAREEYIALLSGFPESRYRPEATFKLGQCEMAMLHFEEAAKIFETFQSDFPEQALVPQAAFMQAEALYEAADYPQAAAAYERFLQDYAEQPQAEQALYKLGQCYLQMEQFDKIAETYRQMLERYPDGAFRSTALFWTAYQAERSERPGEAIGSYETLIRDYPKSQYASEARHRVAMLYYQNDEAEKAAEHFRVLISAAEPPKGLEPSVYFWTGATLARSGQYENAIAVYKRLVERFPRQDFVEETTYQIGQCYYQLGDPDRAAEFFNQVAREFPQGSFTDDALLALARIDLEQQRPEEAAQRLESVLGSPDPAVAAQAGLYLGQALERLGKREEALAAYLRVAFLYDHPELVPEAYWNAIQLLLQQGRRRRAEEILTELKTLYPESQYAKQAQASLAEPSSAGRNADVENATR